MSTTGKSDAAETRLDRTLAVLARVGVWTALFGLLYILRSFFLLIFLTFVFAYVQTRGVERLAPWVRNRTLRSVLVVSALLVLLLAIGSYLAPRFRDQAVAFFERLPGYIVLLDREILDVAARYPFLNNLIPQVGPAAAAPGSGAPHDMSHSLTLYLAQHFLGFDQPGEAVGFAARNVRALGVTLLGIGSAFLLSLLLSFLIVLDLPRLTAGVRSLRNTRVRFIYEEVAESISNFARVMGRALEAQLVIALLNTVLTAIGIVAMGLGHHVAFLAVIVFLGSFIPVAGVFISSVPICLVALQESGFGLVLAGIALITGIHMIEAYILNPRIYGHHFRVNPVLVLIILTVGGKLFAVWGLILGVPVCTYIFGHAIRAPGNRLGS